MPNKDSAPSQASVFWTLAEKQQNGCWNWNGTWFNEQGYGRLVVGTKKTLAHRYAWELTYGKIQDGACVLHSCDNPACVNPEHLRIGTRAENNAERDAKGRHKPHYGDENGMRKHPESVLRGERNATAKLTSKTVLEIRQAQSTGATDAEISRSYSISRIHSQRIRQRKTWAHI